MKGMKDLIVELQSLGLRSNLRLSGRKGGAGPSEGITIFVMKNGEEVPVNVPFYSHYVASSPYELIGGENLKILKNGEDTGLKVRLRPEPNYYDFKTEEGIPLWKIALLHGKDCIGTTLFQRCVYYGKEGGCKFCGIELSLNNGRTVPYKKPEDIYFTAKLAFEMDNVTHITITTGTQRDRRKEVLTLARAGYFAKKAGLNVHIQFSPLDDLKIFDEIKDAGIDTIGIHIESLDGEVLKRISPHKAEIGLKNFLKNWEKGVDLFGWGQVSSFVLIGLGEDLKKTIEGIKLLCSAGVFPFILPFRPVPGTPLYGRLVPPDPEFIKIIYEEAVELMWLFRLDFRNFKAGCVRCGACSAIRFFYK